MIGGGDCIGGRIVKMMPGMTVAEFPFIRFRKPPLNNPSDDRQGQPDEHQVEINAVIFNQGVQSVENAGKQFEQFRISSSWFVLRFQFVSAHAQIAAVAVASLASTFFQSGDLPNAASPNPRPVGALNSIAARSCAMLCSKFMVVENHSADLTMARMAALSGAGSFSQAVTTWDKSGLNVTRFCEALCEGHSISASFSLVLQRVRAPPLPPYFIGV